MDMVRPVTIDNDVLTSTSVAASAEDEWSAVTAYSAGNTVVVSTKKTGSTSDVIHHEYECLVGNTGDYSPDNISGASPKWLDLGAENAWKMFDGGVATQTTDTTEIEVVIEPGGIDTIGMLNIAGGTSVDLSIVSDSVEVYAETKSLVLDNVNDWWQYLFEPVIRKSDIAFTGLPYYSDGEVTVTLIGETGEDVSCGLLIPGLSKNIGDTLWGVKLGITDYSVKETNEFGDPTWLVRGNSRVMECDLYVKNALVDEVYRVLAEYTATPVLWIGSSLYGATLVYGAFKDCQIVMQSYAGSACTLEIEGLK